MARLTGTHRTSIGLLGILLLMLAPFAVSPPAEATSVRVVGISPGADLLWLSNSDLAAELDLYKATGMSWVRVDFDWPSIESRKGTFDWSSTDRVVNAANSRGLQILALPTYSPNWATSVPGNTHAG
ncbi:MAG: beta-galactosidase, partial [Candidatus Nanopelagicales bacterium]